MVALSVLLEPIEFYHFLLTEKMCYSTWFHKGEGRLSESIPNPHANNFKTVNFNSLLHPSKYGLSFIPKPCDQTPLKNPSLKASTGPPQQFHSISLAPSPPPLSKIFDSHQHFTASSSHGSPSKFTTQTTFQTLATFRTELHCAPKKRNSSILFGENAGI